MDHLAADVKGQRLFISGEAAKSLITVDLRAGKVIHETKGLSAMPKKPFYLRESNEVWVTLTDSTVVAISGILTRSSRQFNCLDMVIRTGVPTTLRTTLPLICFMPASKSLKTLGAAVSMDLRMLRST